MASAVFSGTRGELANLMRHLPAILAGREPDVGGIVRGLQLRLGVALLSKVQAAFIVESRGGVGDDGIQWQPLARSTVIGRRRSAGDKKAVTLRQRAPALTEAQRRQIARDTTKQANVLVAKFGLPPDQARGLAKAQVEARARRSGQSVATMASILSGRPVDILRDTGELFRSFSPGVEDCPSGADGQVFDVTPGRVIVGTSKKPWHHRGVPGKLPARPFWPGTLPAAWWQYLTWVYVRGLARVLALVIAKGLKP